MDPRLVTPYLIAALVVFAIYRRMRRSFGRQRVRETSMWIRMGVLTLITALAAFSVVHDIDVLGALAGGIVCGAILGYIGLKHTKFEITREGRFYTPHAYIGLVVTGLFLGRLLYRFLEVYNGVTPPPATGQGLAAAYQRSPFTLAIFGVLVGYYVVYYFGVLQRTRPATTAPSPTV